MDNHASGFRGTAWLWGWLLRLGPGLFLMTVFGGLVLADRDPHSPWLRLLRWSTLPPLLMLTILLAGCAATLDIAVQVAQDFRMTRREISNS